MCEERKHTCRPYPTGTRQFECPNPDESAKSLIVVVLSLLLIFGGLSLVYWVGSHFTFEIQGKIVGLIAGVLFWGFMIWFTASVIIKR